MTIKVICDYCDNEAQLVDGLVIYPHRPDLKSKMFWRCAPCGAYVGVHSNSKKNIPFGRLANGELRRLKMQVHTLFDPLWQTGKLKRQDAYSWLASKLGIPVAATHVGMFDEDLCRRAIDVLKEGL